MGLLDSADRYLRLAQNKRKLGLSLNQPEIHISRNRNFVDELKIFVPIIKLKNKALKRTFYTAIDEFEKTKVIYDKFLKKLENCDIDTLPI